MLCKSWYAEYAARNVSELRLQSVGWSSGAQRVEQFPNSDSGSMSGILYTFWDMGFLVFILKKESFFLPGVVWAKNSSEDRSKLEIQLRNQRMQEIEDQQKG